MKRQRGTITESASEIVKRGKVDHDVNEVIEKIQIQIEKAEEDKLTGRVELVDTIWDENDNSWDWMGRVDLVDEQMSWGSIWLPFWDMDMIDFTNLYADVVWDDDIWGLKHQIPDPFLIN